MIDRMTGLIFARVSTNCTFCETEALAVSFAVTVMVNVSGHPLAHPLYFSVLEAGFAGEKMVLWTFFAASTAGDDMICEPGTLMPGDPDGEVVTNSNAFVETPGGNVKEKVISPRPPLVPKVRSFVSVRGVNTLVTFG